MTSGPNDLAGDERAPAPAPAARHPRLGLPIFLFFAGVYLLAGGRQRPWADGTPMWEVAESLVTKQSIVARTLWNVPRGKDGRIYALAPLATSLVHVPGAYLRDVVARHVPRTADMTWPLASHLGPALLGALTCVLFFRLALRFVGGTAALLSTAAVGLCTGVGFYPRISYSEILQTCAFTGFALALVDGLRAPGPRAGRRLGAWLGLLINAKLVFAVCIPGVAALLAWRLRREPRRLALLFAWAALMLALAAVPILAYNLARWGSLLESGYGSIGGGTFWRGAWGMLFSPGKSVFLYNPPLVVAACAIPALFRRDRLYTLALGAAILPVFVVYARFMYWDGDYAWGPRYLVPFVPALCVALAVAVEAALQRSPARRLLAVAVAAALALGLTVQVLGSCFYWGHWIRIAMTATEQWLGRPICAPPPSKAICWPEGKILYAEHWIPALSPIAGHVWLLRHVPFDDEFRLAERDAPYQWEGHMSVPGAAGFYKATIIDWWPLGWTAFPRARAVLVAAMALLAAAGVVLGWRRMVAARPPPARVC